MTMLTYANTHLHKLIGVVLALALAGCAQGPRIDTHEEAAVYALIEIKNLKRQAKALYDDFLLLDLEAMAIESKLDQAIDLIEAGDLIAAALLRESVNEQLAPYLEDQPPGVFHN